MDFKLTNLDITIMVLYAVLVIAYGLYKGKRKNSEEYFLGGRSLLWPVVGISLFAANISSSTLVGLSSDAFMTNTHVFNYEWLAAVVLVFFAIFFMPFYLRSKIYTMPEFLEKRYDSRSRYYFSVVTIIANVIVDTAAGLYVGLLIMKIFFPHLPVWILISILAIAAASYTIPGGLSSVVHTEVVQAVLLVIGSVLLTYYSFDAVGGWSGMIEGLEGLKGTEPVGEQTPEEIMSMVRPSDDEYMPWYGLLLGAPILGFYFWATNQFMVQRVLSAKDLNHGRWGALFAGFLKLPVLFIMVLPGLVALVLYQGWEVDLAAINYEVTKDGKTFVCEDLKDCPNLTYPVMLFQLLPSPVLGLVLAGLLAAMMSSVSATFNSASTLITMDFVKKMKPDMTSEQLVRAGQIATLVLVILAAAWAPFIERFGSLFAYLQKVIAYTCPPVVAVFILGLFWKRANGDGAFYSLLSGFFIALIFLFNAAYDFSPFLSNIHFLLQAFILMAVCMVIHIGISSMTPAPSTEKVVAYTWTTQMFKEETMELKGVPWYENYRILAVLLLIVTAVLVGMWW